MDQIKEQKCPACGAALRFDPTQGKMVCDYCGTVLEIEAAEAFEPEGETTLEGFDFSSLNEQATDDNADALPIYNCESCGAELIAPAEQAAMTCPYCGNNIVLTNKVSGKLRPDGVLPFKIEAKSLPGLLTNFYKDKILLPKNFFSDSRMGKVTGVYVPFWMFDGTMKGMLRFSGKKTHQYL